MEIPIITFLMYISLYIVFTFVFYCIFMVIIEGRFLFYKNTHYQHDTDMLMVALMFSVIAIAVLYGVQNNLIYFTLS